MSDSFISRKNKVRVSGTKHTLVQTYSKDAGIQLVLTRTDYSDSTHDYSCTVEMCQGHSEKNDNGKGYKTVCNWREDKVMISLNTDELAKFGKYTDTYFIRRLGTYKPVYDSTTGRAVEKDGRPVYDTDKNGKPVIYGETLFHTFENNVTILNLFKNKTNPLGFGISIKKGDKTVTMYLDEDQAHKFAKCSEIAMEKMLMDDVITFKYGNYSNTSSSGSGSRGYSRQAQSQPRSYRQSMEEDMPPMPPMPDDNFEADIDALANDEI